MPRASLAELARALSISPQSVSERLKRLEDVGVLGFAVALDPEKLGLSIGAYIRIQPAMGELARVAEIVKTIPEIVECHRITGEDCFIAKVFVAKVEDLERRDRPADPLRAHQHLDHPVVARAAPQPALCVSFEPSLEGRSLRHGAVVRRYLECVESDEVACVGLRA